MLLAMAISLAIPTVSAQSVSARSTYWDGDKNGWHFYEPKPTKPGRSKPVEPEVAPPTEMVFPPLQTGPAPLSAEWLKDNIPKYQSRAIDNPTPANVELVAYLQRLAMDKAERYSQAMAQVPINNPALDEYARSALTATQRIQAESSMSTAKQQALATLSNRVGLWYFYSSKCPYCAKQDPILDRFETRTGFSILAVSLDGGPLASGSPRSFVTNQGHAERLGVMMTPTLVVADTATGELHNLSAGLRTTAEIEERLLELGKTNKWITEAQYDEAVRGEPRKYLTDGLQTADLQDDPEALLEALRGASYNGASTPWKILPSTQQ